MHSEIKGFFARMKLTHGKAFGATKVLECGSYDINGNPREFFSSAREYVGLDWRPGPCVDIVGLVHEYRARPNGYYDFVIATSLLEHDPHWRESIQRMVDLVAEGGSLLITCGGPGFHEHEIETAPEYSRGKDNHPSGTYYGNRTANDIADCVTQAGRFAEIIIEDDPSVKDIRLFACGLMEPLSGMKVA